MNTKQEVCSHISSQSYFGRYCRDKEAKAATSSEGEKDSPVRNTLNRSSASFPSFQNEVFSNDTSDGLPQFDPSRKSCTNRDLELSLSPAFNCPRAGYSSECPAGSKAAIPPKPSSSVSPEQDSSDSAVVQTCDTNSTVRPTQKSEPVKKLSVCVEHSSESCSTSVDVSRFTHSAGAFAEILPLANKSGTIRFEDLSCSADLDSPSDESQVKISNDREDVRQPQTTAELIFQTIQSQRGSATLQKQQEADKISSGKFPPKNENQPPFGSVVSWNHSSSIHTQRENNGNEERYFTSPVSEVRSDRTQFPLCKGNNGISTRILQYCLPHLDFSVEHAIQMHSCKTQGLQLPSKRTKSEVEKRMMTPEEGSGTCEVGALAIVAADRIISYVNFFRKSCVIIDAFQEIVVWKNEVERFLHFMNEAVDNALMGNRSIATQTSPSNKNKEASGNCDKSDRNTLREIHSELEHVNFDIGRKISAAERGLLHIMDDMLDFKGQHERHHEEARVMLDGTSARLCAFQKSISGKLHHWTPESSINGTAFLAAPNMYEGGFAPQTLTVDLIVKKIMHKIKIADGLLDGFPKQENKKMENLQLGPNKSSSVSKCHAASGKIGSAKQMMQA